MFQEANASFWRWFRVTAKVLQRDYTSQAGEERRRAIVC
jgi:hypothetical protein